MVTVVDVATAVVVTVKVALVFPSGTVTLPLGGREAAAGLSLERETRAPPAGAGRLSVTVPVEGVEPVTLVGLRASEVSVVVGPSAQDSIKLSDHPLPSPTRVVSMRSNRRVKSLDGPRRALQRAGQEVGSDLLDAGNDTSARRVGVEAADPLERTGRKNVGAAGGRIDGHVRGDLRRALGERRVPKNGCSSWRRDGDRVGFVSEHVGKDAAVAQTGAVEQPMRRVRDHDVRGAHDRDVVVLDTHQRRFRVYVP